MKSVAVLNWKPGRSLRTDRGLPLFDFAPEPAERHFQRVGELEGDSDADLDFAALDQTGIRAVDARFHRKRLLRDPDPMPLFTDNDSESLFDFLHDWGSVAEHSRLFYSISTASRYYSLTREVIMTNGYHGTAEIKQDEQEMSAEQPQRELTEREPKPTAPGEPPVRETGADRPAGE